MSYVACREVGCDRVPQRLGSLCFEHAVGLLPLASEVAS